MIMRKRNEFTLDRLRSLCRIRKLRPWRRNRAICDPQTSAVDQVCCSHSMAWSAFVIFFLLLLTNRVAAVARVRGRASEGRARGAVAPCLRALDTRYRADMIGRDVDEGRKKVRRDGVPQACG